MTATTAEAWSLAPQSRHDFSVEIGNKLLEFQASQTVPVASELMFLASQAGDEDNARRAADLIVQSGEKIGDRTILRVANRILRIDPPIEAPAILKNVNDSFFVRESR